FFSSRRRHTRSKRDWSSDVCSSDLLGGDEFVLQIVHLFIFKFDITFKGIPLLLCFKIIICNVQGEKHVSCISTLFSVSFAVRTRSEERRVGKDSLLIMANDLLMMID